MTTLASLLRPSMITGVLLVVAGCATDPLSTTDDVGAAGQDLSQALDVTNPSGAYAARITANGTGCPAGTWEASIAPDGKALIVRLSAYETIIEPGQTFAIRDCVLGIDLRTPNPVAFTVTGLRYEGNATLNREGMTLRDVLKARFDREGSQASADFTLEGPLNHSFSSVKQFSEAERPSSACGSERRLNFMARAMMRNNRDKSGTGYTNTEACDGELGFPGFEIKLDWTPCTASPRPSAR